MTRNGVQNGTSVSAPPALLPTDHPRLPSAASRLTGTERSELDGDARAASDDLLLAGFAAVLHRYTGQDEFAFPARMSDAGAVLFSCAVSGGTTLAGLARDAAAGRSPLDDGRQPGEFELVLLPLDGEGGGRRAVELRYDEALFERATVRRLLTHYRTLLDDGLAGPDRPVSRLRLLPPDELHRVLVEWNDTGAALSHEVCLHEAFEARAAQAPDAIALSSALGGEEWTYARVNAAANRLAHHLRAIGVGRGKRVGICLDRCPDLLVATLGVLKAGGAYVPLDPEYPDQRLAAMVIGTSCTAVVSRSGLAANLPMADERPGGCVVLVDRDEALIAACPEDNPDGGAGPGDLAYVIHTSGSTGAPKPIALRHRGVMNNLADINSRFSVGPGDRVLALSSPSFDMSVYEFLGLTTAGGTVVLPDPDRARDPEHWAELLVSHRVTIWNSAPALLEMAVEHLEDSGARPLNELRLALLGGDWIPVSLPDRTRRAAPGLRFVALGGATEASIHSTLFEVESTDPRWTSIPYGRPMANQRTYILDDHLRPVPPGVAGELHLAGTGLAQGYLDQPERTAERFFEWSCDKVTGERLYRTGDVARYGPDGLIELIGRSDFQVKVNGLRIELGEIEATLRAHEAVKEAVVAAHPDAGGGRRLVGYAVPHAGRTLRPRVLSEHAARSLPGFMVPATLVVLETLPLTANGKVDRKALPIPSNVPAGSDETYVPPATTTEERVAEIFATVLSAPRIGANDSFFGAGGNSLQAVRATSRLTKHFGIKVNLRLLRSGNTVSGVAALIDERIGGGER